MLISEFRKVRGTHGRVPPFLSLAGLHQYAGPLPYTVTRGGASIMKRLIFCAVLMVGLALAGCGTTGKNFDETLVDSIVPGSTSRTDVLVILGKPFKKGIQNNKEVWIYEYNQYKAIGDETSKDIFITFNQDGIVESRQLMVNKGPQ